MRTVFLGTSAFAVQILTRLASSPHRPTLVVTRPDRPRGRGRHLAPPPVAELAHELSLPLAQPERVGDPEAREQIAAEDPAAVVVCAFGALIRAPLLDAHPFVNVHPSLLPRWRGAAPIERALMAGDERTGVAIIALTEGLDSGPVFAMRDAEVDPADTYGTLAPRLAELGGELLVEVLDGWPGKTREQGEDGLTYAEKITAEDRRLDPARPAVELARAVRALSPHIGAVLELPDGERLGVRTARAVPDGPASDGLCAGPGGTPVLGTAAGGLELIAVQPAGKREMPGADWWRGRR